MPSASSAKPRKQRRSFKEWFAKPKQTMLPVLPAFLEIDETHSHVKDLTVHDAHMGSRITDDYRILACVGKGTYGTVWKVLHKATGQMRAIKKLVGGLGIQHASRQIARECLLLQQLNHPNIIRLYDFLPGEGENDIYLVFEFVNTTLLVLLQLTGLRPGQARNLTYQTLKGLKYLHSAEVLHRDLKPENLLVTRDGILKIVDFGLARGLPTHSRYMTNDVATLWYRPIDLLLGSYVYNSGVDMWSMGCIIYEMYSRRPLFDGESSETMLPQILGELGRPSVDDVAALQAVCTGAEEYLRDAVRTLQPRRRLEEADQLDPGLRLFVLPMLAVTPSARCSADRALRAPFMAPFHRDDREPTALGPVRLPYNDDKMYPMHFYKQTLFPQLFGPPSEEAPPPPVEAPEALPPPPGDEWQRVDIAFPDEIPMPEDGEAGLADGLNSHRGPVAKPHAPSGGIPPAPLGPGERPRQRPRERREESFASKFPSHPIVPQAPVKPLPPAHLPLSAQDQQRLERGQQDEPPAPFPQSRQPGPVYYSSLDANNPLADWPSPRRVKTQQGLEGAGKHSPKVSPQRAHPYDPFDIHGTMINLWPGSGSPAVWDPSLPRYQWDVSPRFATAGFPSPYHDATPLYLSTEVVPAPLARYTAPASTMQYGPPVYLARDFA